MNRRGAFDFWVAATTAITTALTFAIAVATPPKSGPFCVDDCIGYPYTDFAAFFHVTFCGFIPRSCRPCSSWRCSAAFTNAPRAIAGNSVIWRSNSR